MPTAPGYGMITGTRPVPLVRDVTKVTFHDPEAAFRAYGTARRMGSAGCEGEGHFLDREQRGNAGRQPLPALHDRLDPAHRALGGPG